MKSTDSKSSTQPKLKKHEKTTTNKSSTNIKMKFLKTSNNEKKASKEEKHIFPAEKQTKTVANFLLETKQDQRRWGNIFKALKEKNTYQLRILYYQKYLSK